MRREVLLKLTNTCPVATEFEIIGVLAVLHVRCACPGSLDLLNREGLDRCWWEQTDTIIASCLASSTFYITLEIYEEQMPYTMSAFPLYPILPMRCYREAAMLSTIKQLFVE